ncbi:uncharacterized protein LOC113871624 [Abrus precatorius]|uniref:Uncharacterized protein LOC113871624 n=1 Tax=Abrus precatorius TaxID=3816 RepID=A0A8B8M9P4_ABRPR|nr:uncharacterized protein LOC113871624 [Abrus precatorius]
MASQELENQMGPIIKKNSEPAQDTFFGNTVENSREYCQTITTRSGKVVEPQLKKKQDEKEGNSSFRQARDIAENRNGESEPEQEKPKEKVRPRQKLVVDEAYWNRTKKQILEDSYKPQIPPPYVKLPYPHIPKNKEKKDQFSKFLDIFRKLHINIPFVEVLEQMPLYAKFMKDLL